MPYAHEPLFRRGLVAGLLVSVAGGVLCAALGQHEVGLLWRAYLVAWLVCWPVALAGLGMLALGNLTGGRWAAAARPFYLAAGQTLPIMMLLAVPLAFGLSRVYPWAEASHESGPHFSPSKAAYLSPPFFLARGTGYAVIWLLVTGWLSVVSRLDRPAASRPNMRRAGALCLVLLVPTATFAAFDWAMSLEPHWYSSIYGAIITAGGVVAVHALAVLGVAFSSPETRNALFIARPHGGEHQPVDPELLNDLGNLLLAFTMVWTYFSFSQFFLIWSANLPSEIVWYERRFSNGWQAVAIVIVLTCFAAPFLSLLSRELKRRPSSLAAVASLLVAAYAVNMYWTIVPAFPPGDLVAHLVNVCAVVALSGLWLALCCWRLGRLGGRRSRGRDLVT